MEHSPTTVGASGGTGPITRTEHPAAGAQRQVFRRYLMPAFLLLTTPPAAILLWYTLTQLGGSVSALGGMIAEQGFFAAVWSIWQPVVVGTGPAWAIIGIFAALQLLLMRVVPGPTFLGPRTLGGYVPRYKANGPACFGITMALFFGASYGLGLFSPGIVYDHFGGIIGALNVASLAICLGLYFKGKYAPTTPDSGTSGSPIFDFYWGTDLHPRVLGWDVKHFTNCRFGMMAWPVIIVSFAAKQHQLVGITDAMLVAVGIQLVYIAKFFWWETGYLSTTDITTDRAGFYICWGCLVWVPAVYTSSTLYLVGTNHTLGWPLASVIFAVGLIAVYVNYQVDAQRQRFRATGGDCRIWGKPPEQIVARYTDGTGAERESLLLVSGWWGVSRHFHYVPEILAAFCWTVPVLFGHLLPWTYLLFLIALLGDRVYRAEKRCAQKYGSYWQTYCERVPYKVIPGVY